MKGTMSEMELSLFRQRSLEALKQKARRGELFLTVAIGYLKTSHDRIERTLIDASRRRSSSGFSTDVHGKDERWNPRHPQ
jgi:DNA invertase Pin-like site-specific DNA recombinase